MDLMLPVVGGIDARRVMKNDAATARIPIVVFSAFCRDLEKKRKALRAGAVECLDKPLDFDRLHALLAEIGGTAEKMKKRNRADFYNR
ncbi:MAG TPA: response regulator [Pyrinomonadaceae bacterium]|jgi:CheY-like chemotaxis protein